MGNCSCTGHKNASRFKGDSQRKSFSSKPDFLDESKNSWTEIPDILDSQDVSLIKSALRKSFNFRNLREEQTDAMVNKFKAFSLESNTLVYLEKSVPDKLYILKSGGAYSIINGNTVGHFKPGNMFGEEEWFKETLREQTVKTSKLSIIFTIEFSDYKESLNTLKKEEALKNKEAILEISLFSSLSQGQIEQITQVARIITYESESYIQEAESADLIVIKSGSFECSKKNNVLRNLYRDDIYGKKAFECGVPKGTSLRALLKSRVLFFGKDTISKIIPKELTDLVLKYSLQKSMSNHSLLSNLEPFQISEISNEIHYDCYDPGMRIELKKEREFWIVIKGAVAIGDSLHKYNSIIDTFADDSKTPEVCQNSILGYISLAEIERILDNKLEKVISLNNMIKSLRTVSIFKCIPYYTLKNIAAKIIAKNYQRDEIIFSEGDTGTLMYIVQSGKVELTRDGKVLRILETHDFFGEKAILKKRVRTANAIARADTVCWLIAESAIANILDHNMKNILDMRIIIQDYSIQLKDLIHIKKLAKKYSRSILLVTNSQNNTPFVLKVIEKSHVQKPELIKMERKIMTCVDHPMIVELVNTYKDNSRIFFLVEYAPGMSLFELMEEYKRIGEKETKFYAACFVLILEYLHSKHIVHRDFKPENIIIDNHGYPKLIDFEAAKTIEDKTYTLVGTPHYMAPEIIQGKGYSFSVDFWSLGVLLYEMITGFLPFGDGETNIMKVYETIIDGVLSIPCNVEELGVVELITQLLQSSPELRGENNDLFHHPFFSGINWDDLIVKKVNANDFIPLTNESTPNFTPPLPVQVLSMLNGERNSLNFQTNFAEF